METENNNQNNISDLVLQKIRAGKVKMKPRAFFVFQVLSLVVVAILVLALSSVVLSYIFFNVIESGRLLLLGFGFQGLATFFLLFPWFILFLDIVLLALFDWLLKRFSFGYKAPMAYLFLGTVGTAIIIGFLFNATPLHRQLLRLAEAKRGLPPPILDFYDHLRRPPRSTGVYRGTVVSVENGGFWLIFDDLEGKNDPGLVQVTLPAALKLPTPLEVGEHVFVAGQMATGTIKAYGVTNISDDDF